MSFDEEIRELNIRCTVGDTRFRIIDSNHGVFMHTFPEHMHSFFELHYVIGGKGALIVDGREYELRAGVTFMTAPRTAHTQINDKTDNMEEYFVAFEIDKQKSSHIDAAWQRFAGQRFVIGESRHNAELCFEEIERELKERKYGYIEAAQTFYSMILIRAMRDLYRAEDAGHKRATLDEMRLSIIDQAMLFRFNTITLKELSELVKLHPRHIQRLIKDKYGLSFAELRKQIRMNNAVELLSADECIGIDAVAERLGYSDRFYFSKQFKEYFGETPAEYRGKLSAERLEQK